MSYLRFGFALAVSAILGLSTAAADDLIRNFGATDVALTPGPFVPQPQPVAEAGSTTTISNDGPAAVVAFHHHRGNNGYYNASFPAAFYAYNTYQPGYPLRYASGYAGMSGYQGLYGVGYPGSYVYSTSNPYGYYPNGWYWGSSGPTYGRPFPVWDSPSGVYDYRYLGWGSYGWGGWGGTGPAGWGYQGGFYW